MTFRSFSTLSDALACSVPMINTDYERKNESLFCYVLFSGGKKGIFFSLFFLYSKEAFNKTPLILENMVSHDSTIRLMCELHATHPLGTEP